MSKSILITGAGGFIGGFIVAEALKRGYETLAAVRETTSRQFLTDERIHFLVLDYDDPAGFRLAMEKAVEQMGRPWDYVVHNLGATKAANYLEFERVNNGYLRLTVDTLKEIGAVPGVFLLMSSLSVMGRGDDRTYAPFSSADVPQPNTHYGMSKAKAEQYLMLQPASFPYTIFRCTGVYGPHERDYFLMMKSIKRGFDFSVGFRKQMLTFIYAGDLAQAVMMALEAGPKRRAYFLSEPRSYTQAEFRKIVLKHLGKKLVIPVTAPLWLVRMVCWACGQYTRFTGKPTTLNPDKYKILAQRNWQCDTADATRDLGFTASTSLDQGVEQSIAWYRQAGWL